MPAIEMAGGGHRIAAGQRSEAEGAVDAVPVPVGGQGGIARAGQQLCCLVEVSFVDQDQAEIMAGLPRLRGQAALLGDLDVLLGELPGPGYLTLPQRDLRQVGEGVGDRGQVP
jgi:hypothetical protein